MSEHESTQYLIRKTENRVELWSKKRLPFEPKGWLRTMRDELNGTLKTVRSVDESILYAFYSSSKMENFDVENVLFIILELVPINISVKEELVLNGDSYCHQS